MLAAIDEDTVAPDRRGIGVGEEFLVRILQVLLGTAEAVPADPHVVEVDGVGRLGAVGCGLRTGDFRTLPYFVVPGDDGVYSVVHEQRSQGASGHAGLRILPLAISRGPAVWSHRVGDVVEEDEGELAGPLCFGELGFQPGILGGSGTKTRGPTAVRVIFTEQKEVGIARRLVRAAVGQVQADERDRTIVHAVVALLPGGFGRLVAGEFEVGEKAGDSPVGTGLVIAIETRAFVVFVIARDRQEGYMASDTTGSIGVCNVAPEFVPVALFAS